MNIKYTKLYKHKEILKEDFGTTATLIGIGVLGLSIIILRTKFVKNLLSGAALAIGGLAGYKIATIINKMFTPKSTKWSDCIEIKDLKEQKECAIYKLLQMKKYLIKNMDVECKLLQNESPDCKQKIISAIKKIDTEITHIRNIPKNLGIFDIEDMKNKIDTVN